MTFKYTLRLMTNGAEVWKRWTGDRDEALRDLAATIIDLNPDMAESFMTKAVALAPMNCGDMAGVSALSADLSSVLWFEVKRKGQGVVT